MSTSIAVISGKGGAGKSFFCVNIGAALMKLGFPTLIVDTDSGMRNIDLILRKSNSLVFDLSDVAQGNCSLEDAVTPVSSKGSLSMIACAKDPDFIPSAELLRSLADKLSERFAFIIFDAPAGVGATVRNTVEAADRTVVVTNPQKESALPAAAVSETASRISPSKPIHIILNKVDPKGISRRDMSPDEIMDACVARLLGVIYSTDEVEKCRDKGTLLSLTATHEALQLHNIARRLCGESVPLLL